MCQAVSQDCYYWSRDVRGFRKWDADEMEEIVNATMEAPFYDWLTSQPPPDNETDFSVPRKEVTLWIYRVGYPIVLFLGMIGNCLNLTVLWRSRRLRKVSYILFRWLAVADFMVVVMLITFDVIRSRVVHRTEGVMMYYSHWCFFLFKSFMCCSALLIMGLTIDRYILVCHPHKCQSSRVRRSFIQVSIILIFALSFFLHVPHTFETSIVPVLEKKTNITLYYDWVWNPVIRKMPFFTHAYPILKETIVKLIPITCVLILNPLIVRAHSESVFRKQSLKNKKPEEIKKSSKETRVFVLLLSATIIFLVCTLPQAFVTVIQRVNPALHNVAGFYVFEHTANLIETINFAINFYIYNLASSDFRKSFREVIPCFAKMGVDESSEVTTLGGHGMSLRSTLFKSSGWGNSAKKRSRKTSQKAARKPTSPQRKEQDAEPNEKLLQGCDRDALDKDDKQIGNGVENERS